MRTWLILLAACSPEVVESTPDPELDRSGACPWDDDQPIVAEAAQQGFLCPTGDRDRYAIPGGEGELVGITLAFPHPDATPLALTWTLWDAAGVEVLATPAAGEVAGIFSELSLIHRLPASGGMLEVRDAVDGASDTTYPYTLTVEHLDEPDPYEPNEQTPTTAISGSYEGAISFRGDVDRYAVNAGEGGLLEVRLEAALTGWTPKLSILAPDGEPLFEDTVGAPQGLAHALATHAGIHTLVVEDADGTAHGLTAVYDLAIVVRTDPDPTEPDDHPSLARDLGNPGCEPAWTYLTAQQGHIASSGDVDWLHLQLPCALGILEADLDFDASLPAAFQPELRLVREEPGSACTLDQECQRLDVGCDDSADCEGLGNLCLAEGVCAGAGMCLPTGTCGATVLQEVGQDGDGALTLSAPVAGPARLWLAVSDHRGDATAPDATWDLQVRTRREPDAHEPDGFYTAGPPSSSDAGLHTPRATEIDVHDCTLGDCCDSTTWEHGQLATAYDQDWLRYRHPCPGGDCMLRVHWDFDEGPVDFYTALYRGTQLWYDQLAATSEAPYQGQREGIFGGLELSDTCFYAFSGHTGSPYWYHLALRDTRWLSPSDPQGGVWDHDAEQTWRVCVEKIADGCQSPCQILPASGQCNP